MDGSRRAGLRAGLTGARGREPVLPPSADYRTGATWIDSNVTIDRL
jgi:hypothetical protein